MLVLLISCLLAVVYAQGFADVYIVEVKSQKMDCVAVVARQCLIVDDKLFYNNIVGFNFIAGYTYRLKIQRQKIYNAQTVPADGSLYRYRLLQVLEKIKATN